MPEGNCDKLILQSLSDLCDNIEYDFSPIRIHYPLTPFLEVLTHCIKNGMNCAHLHTLMQREFFFLLRGFYEKQEIATLLHPIIGKEMDFKDFVMRNHTKVDNIEQLISLSNLGRTPFFLQIHQGVRNDCQTMDAETKEPKGYSKKMTEPGVCIKRRRLKNWDLIRRVTLTVTANYISDAPPNS